ncbi:MAG: ABC transporter permease [Oscillospiraceae bacterium]|jgi:putative ABC transport system permease protein
MLDSIKKGLSELFRNKLRSFLTIGGIMIGVLSVVVISAIGETGKSAINSQLVSMGMDSVIISGDKSNATGLGEDDLESVRTILSVKDAMPILYLTSQLSIFDRTSDCMLWGVNEDADKVIELKAIHGRLLTKGDVSSSAKVCLVDEQIALENYKRSNIVGKTITVSFDGRLESFEVVGVVRTGVNILQNVLGDMLPGFVYIPYTTMRDESMQSYFDQIAVKLSTFEDIDNISEAISRAILTDRPVTTALSVENLLKQKSQLNDILGVITVVLSAIAGISLVVSGLSIMTVMLVSVNERTREIGIKKSIGATNADIMLEFLIESMLITFIGGVSGSLMGIFLTLAGCRIFGLTPIINFNMIGGIMLLSVIIGLAFGVYPAYRASKLKPVDALRYE